MGTSLTGLTPAATYDGLLKTTDNQPIGATEKVVTDGIGNNSVLQVGTASASVQGIFQVTGSFKDSSGDVGSSGQFLSSNGTGTNWVEVSIPAGVFEAGSGTDSIQAVGGSATASGDYSFAMGKTITASGDYSFAHGSNTTASGDYSFAFGGGQATGGRSMASMTGAAAGHGSIALGYASQAGSSDGGSPYGDGQVALGTNAQATGQFAMALGGIAFGNTTVSGDYSTAIGYGPTASGNYCTAIGPSSTASGYMSTVMGANSTASGDYSTVIGNYSTCAIAESVVIGNAITANRGSTTHVNNLSIMDIPTSASGLPSGAVWRNGTVLNIVA